MENNIGIMIGRLSPISNNKIQEFPSETWQHEFFIAKKIGFASIEWIFDEKPNPITDNSKIQEIRKISDKFDININSLCADYFMDNKLFNNSQNNIQKNLKILSNLIEQCHKIGIKIIELPFVDSSSIKNQNFQIEVVKNLESILKIADDCGVIIALETDLDHETFKDLIKKFKHPKIMANYDIGNSTSSGFNTINELNKLKNWIVNIHVKDRKLNGPTVPLGQGDADFNGFFSSLKEINYREELIIQGAREDITDTSSSPIKTCEKYYSFVKQYLNKY